MVTEHLSDNPQPNNFGPEREPERPVAATQALGCGGYGIWFLWLLTSTLGAGMGWALGWRLSFEVPGVLATWVIGGVAGGVLGTFQAAVVRPVIGESIWWILSSISGWSLGFFLGAQVASFWGLTEFVFGGVLGAVLGLTLGILQWLVLRGKVRGAGWWVVTSTLAWTASLVVYLPGVNAMGLVYGAVSGAITGLVLLGLWLGNFQSKPSHAEH